MDEASTQVDAAHGTDAAIAAMASRIVNENLEVLVARMLDWHGCDPQEIEIIQQATADGISISVRRKRPSPLTEPDWIIQED